MVCVCVGGFYKKKVKVLLSILPTPKFEAMCRKKVDTPWSIYRDFTVRKYLKVTIDEFIL